MPSTIDELLRSESRRVLATLIRLLGDFDLAEEALQDAFAAAVERWPEEGVPANPRAWLVSTGRFKAIDGLRLIFTCCHPALPADAQIALTLREVCGLTTEEIARRSSCRRPRWRSGSSGPRPRSSSTRATWRRPANR